VPGRVRTRTIRQGRRVEAGGDNRRNAPPRANAQMENVLLTGSIGDIRNALTAHEISVREMTDWYVARIEGLGSPLNAVRALSEDFREVARQRDDELAQGRIRGRLHGIPVLVKDNVAAGSGMTTTAGARALAGHRSRKEATLVRRLRDAGAIILGKTNMTEFADYVSDVMPSGFSGIGGTVVNPFTREGYGRGLGSSVGSAAAVAASLVPIAIGSETQNSIQTPSSVTSLAGFKPSVGMVSRSGIIPLVPSQDSPGPLARSVADLHEVFAAIAGPDPRDAATLGLLDPIADQLELRQLGCIRIGVMRRMIADRKEFESVMPAFEAVLEELRRAGATIVDPCDLPSAEQLQDVRSCVFRSEFKAALDAFLDDSEWRGEVGSLADIIRWNESHPDAIPYGQSLLVAAAATGGLGSSAYRSDRRRDIALSRYAGIDAALRSGSVDALIAPMGAAAKCTGKSGYPVLAIPAGKDPSGMPFGVTLTSGFASDEALLAVGLAVAKVIGRRLLPDL
jgi:amidase